MKVCGEALNQAINNQQKFACYENNRSNIASMVYFVGYFGYAGDPMRVGHPHVRIMDVIFNISGKLVLILPLQLLVTIGIADEILVIDVLVDGGLVAETGPEMGPSGLGQDQKSQAEKRADHVAWHNNLMDIETCDGMISSPTHSHFYMRIVDHDWYC